MKLRLLLVPVLFSFTLFAQVPEDAIRYSWYPHHGTARNMATGGVMGSLGGDITAAFVNPAGLGFFKTNEAVLSSGLLMNSNKAVYRDSSMRNKKNALTLGPSGVIIGWANKFTRGKSNAFSIAVNQTASFNNITHYSAMNNYSSFAEQFAEEFAKSNLSISEVLYSNSVLPFTAAPALQTYLIDTVSVNGQIQVKAATEYLLDSGKSLLQEMNKTTRGGKYELAFSFSENIKDKWLWGATLGIPVIDYRSTTVFSEKDLSGDTSNHFSSFSFTDDFKTQGIGGNIKLGVIYRPQDYIRLGLAVHTPDFLLLTDTRNTSITTNLENPVKSFSETSRTFTNNRPGESKYLQSTAWKAIASASYVFREVENVKKQRAFLSADLEYVHHKASRFSSANEEPTTDEKAYFKSLNQVIKNDYKGTFNFRAGGEIKMNVWMARLGFAYYGNPYQDASFKAGNTLFSGGLGYRNKGFFVDLTYVYSMKKDVQLPYRLEDRDNTFASISQNQGNVMATVGVKF
jgi:hypothetical protein